MALSSYVTHGHVGLRAILPALEAFGHEVVALPTVLYSNHAGLSQHHGVSVPIPDLDKMVHALEKNGALSDIAAVLTGYLPTPEHVNFACSFIERVRILAPEVVVICDPILGDAPKGLYVSKSVAEKIRTDLLPRATFLTPNFFEFCWLIGRSLTTYAECIEEARALCSACVLVTSVPFEPSCLTTLLVENHKVQLVRHPKLSSVPHGTGDFLAGLMTAQLVLGHTDTVLGHSMGLLFSVVTGSTGFSDLQIYPSLEYRENIPPLPVETLTENGPHS